MKMADLAMPSTMSWTIPAIPLLLHFPKGKNNLQNEAQVVQEHFWRVY